MITNIGKQVELTFGKGDICITGGHIIYNGNKTGIVTFSNQSPREIGSAGAIEAGQKYDISEFPVIMTFTKPESIDAIISQLQRAKSSMLGKQRKSLL